MAYATAVTVLKQSLQLTFVDGDVVRVDAADDAVVAPVVGAVTLPTRKADTHTQYSTCGTSQHSTLQQAQAAARAGHGFHRAKHAGVGTWLLVNVTAGTGSSSRMLQLQQYA